MIGTAFAGLSPEVISGRLYAGAGDGPLLAAAAVWDRLAGAWGSAVGSYRAVVAELTDGPWRGAAAASMAEAAQRYAAWMQTIADGAGQTANRLRVAAAVYRRAFAAVVPPSVVAANRSELSSLVAGNVFGQNAGLIAANQAEYAQMSAQDVAAMYDYAAGSAAATTLPSFSAPPNATAGAAGQTQAAQAAQANQAAPPGPLTQLAQSIVDNPTVEGLNSFLGSFNSVLGVVADGTVEAQLEYMMAIPAWTGAATANVGYAGSLGLIPVGLASSVPAAGAASTLAGSTEPVAGGSAGLGAGGSTVSAGSGRAVPVGRLSVPASWAEALPQTRFAGVSLATGSSVLAGPAGVEPPAQAGWTSGLAMVGGMTAAATGTGSSAGPSSGRTTAGPQPAAAVGPTAAVPAIPRTRPGADDRTIAELRRTVAKLTHECEVLEGSADTLLREAGVRPPSPRRPG